MNKVRTMHCLVWLGIIGFCVLFWCVAGWLLVMLVSVVEGQVPQHNAPDRRLAAKDSMAWVTYKVDSLNVGHCHPDSLIEDKGGLRMVFSPGIGDHEDAWVYSRIIFMSEARLPLTDVKEPWLEEARERICRICLRHEYQALRVVFVPLAMSPFDSLKARLVKGGDQ